MANITNFTWKFAESFWGWTWEFWKNEKRPRDMASSILHANAELWPNTDRQWCMHAWFCLGCHTAIEKKSLKLEFISKNPKIVFLENADVHTVGNLLLPSSLFIVRSLHIINNLGLTCFQQITSLSYLTVLGISDMERFNLSTQEEPWVCNKYLSQGLTNCLNK